MSIRPLTPKEFSAAIAGLRCERWVCRECRKFLKRQDENRRREKRGLKPLPRVGIETLTAGRFIIPGTELARFRPSLAPFGLSVCQ